MALLSKVKKFFGIKKLSKKEQQKEMEFYKGIIEYHNAIENTNRDKFAIEAMKQFIENGETRMAKYYYAMPHTRDGKQGFAMLNFEHTYMAELYRDGGEREIHSPTYGRFVVKTEDGYEVERLDEKQTMELKEQIDLEQTNTLEC